MRNKSGDDNEKRPQPAYQQSAGNVSRYQNWPEDSIFGASKTQKQITELYVVIDTLQTNLRAATTYLNEEQMVAVDNHSYKWCTNWKPGDEKQ